MSIRIAGHRVLMIVIVTIDCSAALATSQGGTDQTKAHTPGMMAWKALFLADANGNETTADAHVKDVIAFIASLQAK